jgi:hypothetical protein
VEKWIENHCPLFHSSYYGDANDPLLDDSHDFAVETPWTYISASVGVSARSLRFTFSHASQ